MDKPDYVFRGLMLCGDCGEPVGAGAFAVPATGGISSCKNPEFVRNKAVSNKPKQNTDRHIEQSIPILDTEYKARSCEEANEIGRENWGGNDVTDIHFLKFPS
jgi:hypothetical protein